MNSRFLLRAALPARQSLSVSSALARPGLTSTLAAGQRRFIGSDAVGQEFIDQRQHHKDHAGKSADMWRKISFYICIPFATVMGVYIYRIESEHIHHRDHEIEENGGELPETVKYEYNDMRKKPFPWAGNGKDNSFFFNPKANRNIDL